jgi:glutathione peroxidase
MSQYAGKKVMVVNVASYCAYTPQYAPLSRLDSIYSARYNFAIIGFPCDDFGNQGGRDSVIITTCNSYHVNFQIMSKVFIKTADTAPVYKWLQRRDLNGVADAPVGWNFNKYLIDRQGHWVRWFASATDPLDTAITNWIVADSAAISTGINNVPKAETSLYMHSENPATGTISLEIEVATSQHFDIDLYSIDGRLAGHIYAGSISGTQQIDYSVASLPSGIYLIRAHSGEYSKTLKCVVEH